MDLLQRESKFLQVLVSNVSVFITPFPTQPFLKIEYERGWGPVQG